MRVESRCCGLSTGLDYSNEVEQVQPIAVPHFSCLTDLVNLVI
jgi:hypothetical protein